MNTILLENKARVLERLILQDIVASYGMQKSSEASYDNLMAKVLDRTTGFYDELELDTVSLKRLNQYGDRSKIYTEQLRADLDKAAEVTVRQIIKQLPREKLSGHTAFEVIQSVRPVLKKRMEVLRNLLSASSLQMQSYMLLWDYQDLGYSHYCLLTEGENCDDCNSLAGQIFSISRAKTGENFPPMHPNCNCRMGILDAENRIIAVIGEGKELEIDPDDKKFKKQLDTISNVLNTASLIPGLDTFTNLASIPVDLARGDFVSAGLSALGVIPVVGEIGDAAKLAKMADKAVDVAKVADKVSDAAKGIKRISPSKLTQTHKLTLSKKQYSNLIESIRKNGITEPIKYVEYKGTKYVVDGHHRLRAAKQLKLDKIPTQKVSLPYKGYKTINDLLWFD